MGYPTPESRVWEKGSGSASGKSPSTDTSPPPAPVQQRRGVCIRPWKGPLPRPRVTPPVALAAFLPKPPSTSSAAAPTSVPSQPAAAALSQATCMERNSIQNTDCSLSMHAGGPGAMGVPKKALRLGRTLSWMDLTWRPRAVQNPNAFVRSISHMVPASSSSAPSYVDALLRRSSPAMSDWPSQPTVQGCCTGGAYSVSCFNRGTSRWFWCVRGASPFWRGSNACIRRSAAASPVPMAAAPVQAPVIFGAGNKPAPRAPLRPKNKRKGGRRDAAATATVPPRLRSLRPCFRHRQRL